MEKISASLFEESIQELNKGKSILYPTDTVWALGCDAEHESAVQKIAGLKGFQGNSPMIVLVSSLKMLMRYVPQLPPKAGDLIEFYDKPLTILYENSLKLPDCLKAGDGTVAIRLVREPFCAALVNGFGKAVLATMACRVNDPVPYAYDDIAASIKSAADHTVAFNRNFKGISPSAIIRIDRNNELQFIRREGEKFETGA